MGLCSSRSGRMQSSWVVVRRALGMLTFLVALPLAAITGTDGASAGLAPLAVLLSAGAGSARRTASAPILQCRYPSGADRLVLSAHRLADGGEAGGLGVRT